MTESAASIIANLAPQFIVEHRVKETFEKAPEVRSYSMSTVAAAVTLCKHRVEHEKFTVDLKMPNCEKTENPIMQNEDIDNLLGNLHFRLNDACLLSPEDKSPDQPSSRASPPATPRPFNGLLSPGEQSRDHSRSRGNSPAPLSPSGLLTPVNQSRSQSRNGRATQTTATKSGDNEDRIGRKLMASSMKLKKVGLADSDLLYGGHGSDPVDLLNGDYLDKLQEKAKKASATMLHDQLLERRLKEPADLSSVRPKTDQKGAKVVKRKKKTSVSADHTPHIASSQVRTKLSSVKNFKELNSD